MARRARGRNVGHHRCPHRGAPRRNLNAADLVLSAEDRAKLDIVSAPPLLCPYWHQANTASDRLSVADLSLLSRI